MTATEALSWTLLHFLWQGAVIGVLTMVALWIAGRPETRYVVGCLGLAAMATAAVGTFAYLWGGGPGQVLVLVSSGQSILESVLPWVNRVWVAGTGALLLRALGGWLVARRRTRTAVSELSTEWADRAGRLAARLGVEGRARVLESAAVAVPMVFGWLKPVVLLPACALSGLTVGQVEALLAHELAHVRRHDYLVNLVQTALESLLFYHPVVWWVSGRVRRERELCCDEVAVAVCGDRLAYSTALLRMEETRVAVAMAANGGSLHERIGRVLGMSETRIGWTPVWMLGGVLLICMGVAWANTEQAPPPPPPPPPPPAVASAPDAPPPPPPPPPPPARRQERRTEDMKRVQEEMKRVEMEMERANAELERAALKLKQSGEFQQLSNEQRAKMEQDLERVHRELELMKPEMEKKARELELQAQKMTQLSSGVNADEIGRRIQYAEERFAKDGVSGLLTDRGKAYLKFGPPDEIESRPGQGEKWSYRGHSIEFDGAGKAKVVSGVR